MTFRPDGAILCQPTQRPGELITLLVDRGETIRVAPFGAFVALETKSQGVALGFSMDDPLGRIAAGIAVEYCYGNAYRDTNPQEKFQTPDFTMAPSSCSAASRF
ncbi:MAG: hypothetical protein KDB01_00415 [Planctomycetaceae bacterium]|nr:hypothetical protein [Planctomycetaceae bacterium]